MQNIEIKAQVENIDPLFERAESLPAVFQWQRQQIDTYFKVPQGKLKLREETGQNAVLISYHRSNVKQPKLSEYQICPTPNAAQLLQVLDAVLPQDVRVEKQRTLYMWKNVRVHFDRVAHLGDFMELEAVLESKAMINASRDAVQFLLEYFAISSSDLVEVGYDELLRDQPTPC